MEKTYTEEQIEEIKEEAKKETINFQLMQFAKQLESVSNSLYVSQKKNIFNKQFSMELVQQYLSNPQKYSKEIRQMSMVLYTLSPLYSQIINYFPSLALFIPVVTPNLDKFTDDLGNIKDENKLKKEYLKSVNFVERMNIGHEFSKVLENAGMNDVVYCYIHSDNTGNFYLQHLDPDYCRITSVVQGVYSFDFDFKFFDSTKNMKGLSDDGEVDDLVKYYPKEFQEKYQLYLDDRANKRFQTISEKKSFAFKFNEGIPFEFPPYSNLFSSISYLEDIKDLLKTNKQNEAYKFIGMQLPIKSNAQKEDDFAVSVNTAMSFYQMLLSNLPDGIGAFLSATPFEAISFSGGAANEFDQINNVENNLFVSSGISPTVFGKNASTSTGLKTSSLQDSSRLYKLYEQFQRILNRFLGFEFKDKFKVELLKVTTFTVDDEVKKQKELASLSVPNKLILSALAGVSQADERAMCAMERILDLSNEWTPLISSYTQGNDDSDSDGRPESDNPTDSAETTKDRDDNVDK